MSVTGLSACLVDLELESSLDACSEILWQEIDYSASSHSNEEMLPFHKSVVLKI